MDDNLMADPAYRAWWESTAAGNLERIRRKAAALGASDLADRAEMTREYMLVRGINALSNQGDDACPTCGPICGMREFGWESDDDRTK